MTLDIFNPEFPSLVYSILGVSWEPIFITRSFPSENKVEFENWLESSVYQVFEEAIEGLPPNTIHFSCTHHTLRTE